MADAAEKQEEQQEPTRLEQLQEQDPAFLIKRAAEAVKVIKKHESERSEVNSKIKAKREELEALGITKQALALAIKVSKMDETQLDGFWMALQIMLKAIDKPIRQDDLQTDLFE